MYTQGQLGLYWSCSPLPTPAQKGISRVVGGFTHNTMVVTLVERIVGGIVADYYADSFGRRPQTQNPSHKACFEAFERIVVPLLR